MNRRAKPTTHGGARAGAGVKPPRGEKASVVVAVRFTPAEADALDAHLARLFPGVTRAAFVFEAVMRLVRGRAQRE